VGVVPAVIGEGLERSIGIYQKEMGDFN
jgi:hypothetical protein